MTYHIESHERGTQAVAANTAAPHARSSIHESTHPFLHPLPRPLRVLDQSNKL